MLCPLTDLVDRSDVVIELCVLTCLVCVRGMEQQVAARAEEKEVLERQQAGGKGKAAGGGGGGRDEREGQAGASV